MVSNVENAKEMSFVDIGETYPDMYVLVKIIEINHDKGKHVGLALYLSDDRDALVDISLNEVADERTIIIPGDNLLPTFGGML